MSETSNNTTADNSPRMAGLETDNAPEIRKETTRTFIAQLYVWAFFIVIGLVLIGGLISGFTVDEHKDMLITVSGVLSGPLGFIVGIILRHQGNRLWKHT